MIFLATTVLIIFIIVIYIWTNFLPFILYLEKDKIKTKMDFCLSLLVPFYAYVKFGTPIFYNFLKRVSKKFKELKNE